MTAATFLIALGFSEGALAALIAIHQGDSDPASENFGLWPFNGGMTTAPLANDSGQAAWQIENTSSGTHQAVYIQAGGTGPWLPGGSGLTQAQIDDILANGFTMTLRARIVEGPIYDPSGTRQVSSAISVAGFSGFRFDIGLGSDGQGNTLVVLPSVVSQAGAAFAYVPSSAPLFVSGNDYHLYQLSYDPTSLAASFFLDGNLISTGYSGASVGGGSVANNYGLAFASLNLSTGNFALARLESGQLAAGVPEPATLALLALGAAALGFSRRRTP